MSDVGIWRKCSSCKKDIALGQTYYVCSVSTCSGKATGYVFCSVACWDAHLPIERHREGSAGALERTAPKTPEAEPAARRVIVGSSAAKAPTPAGKADEDEILVVVSKVRKYIADRSGMNTSAAVYDVLSDRIRRLCDMAIDQARAQGRKTVMEPDVPS